MPDWFAFDEMILVFCWAGINRFGDKYCAWGGCTDGFWAGW